MKKHINYPGYIFLENGEILSKKGAPLKAQTCKDGYRVGHLIHKDGKRRFVRFARVCYEAFNGPLSSDMVVNHINTIRNDDRVENLEACTPKSNILHSLHNMSRGEKHFNSKLSDEEVDYIVKIKGRVPQRELKEKFNVSTTWISMIQNRLARKGFPYEEK